MKPARPPRWATWLLSHWGHPDTREEAEGDLLELYACWAETLGRRRADRRYAWNALKLLRPLAQPKRASEYSSPFFLSPTMLRNYFKIAWRNMVRNKVYSAINTGGLAVGMAVAMLIGLWVWDEVSYNTSFDNYDRIAQVMQNQALEQGIQTFGSLPMPLSGELRTNYAEDFEAVVAALLEYDQTVAYRDKRFSMPGGFAEEGFPDLFSLDMIRGTRDALKNPTSILLAESTAKALFGADEPVRKIIKLGNQFTLQVAGVYRDFPDNSQLKGTSFIAPVRLLFPDGRQMNNWKSSSFRVFAQLKPGRNFRQVSSKIEKVLTRHDTGGVPGSLFLYPMLEWHLYSDWKNGTNASGRIQYVWLFGLIGGFILLLACINFTNLSTARSQTRAKEVGLRKAVGSRRSQLIGQFFGESLVAVTGALGLALLLVVLLLPFFNDLAAKTLALPWSDARFWALLAGFSLFTAFVAGSYPALYLSSFKPVVVLKSAAGRLQTGRLSTLPRQVLVVVQFTVSVALIIGTLLVFKQIEHVKNRPIGYSREGLLNIVINSPDIADNYEVIQNTLRETGAVAEMGRSSTPITGIWSSANNLDWKGRSPNRQVLFGTISVTPDFGRIVGWKVREGREFSTRFPTDTTAMMFNQSAIKIMGLQNPIGEVVRWHDKNWKIIGVLDDMVMQSPFEPVGPAVFIMDERERPFNVIHLRLNPRTSVSAALGKIEAVFKTHNPDSPFEYKFAEQEYATKFASEERIGTLASVFAGLAIFISCLGLFGLAAFLTEARTKEIGVRKVLGASVLNVWALLSKDFVRLVLIAFLIATPLAWYFLNDWLQNYEYRTDLSWWIFAASGAGAVFITLLTVSFQSVKAALTNPVKSLRSE